MATSSTNETPSNMEARLESIWLKAIRRQPMESKEKARLVSGKGIEGNANQGGKRQITLLDADRWDEVCRELEAEVDPSLRRANLFIRGLDLRQCQGRILLIGSCRLQIHGETRPCRRMDEAHPGLHAALKPDWRGGIHGEALDDGEISLGDPVRCL